jgi:predicted O-linked N-acetylglucosamine transferase (SPINDLY family)
MSLNTGLDNQPLYQQAMLLQQSGRLLEAAEALKALLHNFPDHCQLLTTLGLMLLKCGHFAESADYLQRAIGIDASSPQTYLYLGLAKMRLKQYQAALVNYEQAITLKADYADAYCNKGNVQIELKQLEAALQSFETAIAIQPDMVLAYYNRGNLLRDLKRFDQAVDSYRQAIAFNPNFAPAFCNLGSLLREMKLPEEALGCLDKAIALQSHDANAFFNRGNVLQDLKRHEQAVLSYRQAVQLKADMAEAYSNLGNTLKSLHRFDEALACYEQAIKINPEFYEAFYNRAVIMLQDFKSFDEALLSCNQAIALKNDYAEAYVTRGMIFDNIKQFADAYQSYDQALAINPGMEFAAGQALFSKLMLCAWQDWPQETAKLLACVAQDLKVICPFMFHAVSDDPALQLKVAKIWVQEKCPSNPVLPAISRYPQHQRIRIGYFSADFRHHPVALLTAQLYEMHDRQNFEIFGFSSSIFKDDMTTRLEKAFDRFIDIQNLSDLEAAELARKLEIDIAVDLGGHTGENRNGVFAMRAAPVQVSYIGFLGTMGADYMDYLLADQCLIPETARQYYSEKIAYLPSFQVNDSKREIADIHFSRKKLGLPAQGFIFCCFNNTYKLNLNLLNCWMRILTSVPDSILWLNLENDTVQQNLQQAALASGVNPERLIFAQRLPLPEYLARYRSADLFLDTLPYNAGTTGSDALWAGLPVLTCAGRSFASRMAASLLTAIELPELITNSLAEYEALAIALATDAEKMAAIKAKLAANRLTTKLFDTPLFTRNIESAYRKMYQNHRAGLPPEHILP